MKTCRLFTNLDAHADDKHSPCANLIRRDQWKQQTNDDFEDVCTVEARPNRAT